MHNVKTACRKNITLISARWLITLLMTLASCAWGETSLWQVTKDNQSVFLGGTMHMLRPTDYPLPQPFTDAFAQSQRLYFETDLNAMQSPQAQAQLMSMATAPESEKISRILTPEIQGKLSEALQQRGLSLEMFEPFRVGIVILTLQTTELMNLGLAKEGVDVFFYKQAKQKGLPIGSLESVESQLEFISTMGQGWENEFVELSLEELKNTSGLIEEMTRAWKQGDTTTLDKLFIQEMKQHFPKAYEQLLVHRNQLWLPQIEAMFTQPGTELVLVGTAHMVGPEGLLLQLQQRGYQVKQL